jgi:hypothetical protein
MFIMHHKLLGIISSLLLGAVILGAFAWSGGQAQPVMAAQATFDPRPLCADRTGATNPVVRYDIPFGSVSSGGIYCRVLVENSTYRVNSGEIGSQALIDLGIVNAVDVFAILFNGTSQTVFNNPVKICILGTGALWFLDASQSPRTLVQLTAAVEGGYTCGSVSTAGIMAMVSGTPLVAPTTAPVVDAQGTPLPTVTPGGPTLTPTTGAVGAATLLTNCSLTTTRIVRLREEPNTTSRILTRLPFDTTWRVTERVEGWYRIVWTNRQGWVSAQFARTSGSC